MKGLLLSLLMMVAGTAVFAAEPATDIERVEAAAAASRAALNRGDYVKALEHCRLGRLYSPDDEADDMLRLVASEIAFATGDYDESLALADSVTTPRYALTATTHRVRALTMLERYEAAVATADSALAVVGNVRSDTRAALLQNRGYARWAAGQLEEAGDDLRIAADMMADPTDRLNLLGNLAVVESEAGDHADAIDIIGRVVRGLPADSPDGITALRKQGEILRRAGRKAEAARIFRRYFNKEKAALRANLPSMTPSERLNYWVREKALLSRCFDPATDAAFLFDVAVFRRLTSLLGMRDSAALDQLLAVDHTGIRKSLRRGEAAVEFVSFRAERDSTVYAAVVLPQRGQATFVPIISETELTAPGRYGAASIEDALRKENKRLKNSLYSDTMMADRLWTPVLEALPPDVQHIYFAPEGIFHLWGIENMPFTGRDRLQLHRVSSTASLLHRDRSKAAPDSMLVVGGLDYNRLEAEPESGSGNHDAADALFSRGIDATFSYLKGTEAEADSIGRIHSSATVFHAMGEGRMKAVMPAYGKVHIATHGYSLAFGVGQRPEFLADSVAVDRSLLASGLALSGANLGYDFDSGEDGLLSAREICDMDLSGVDFVIMSACRTAVGNVNDEGAAGLVRALKMAGVNSIVATFWEVDDMSTMLFMQAFHQALAQGHGKRQAFDIARRRVRDQPTAVTYRPFSPGLMARSRTKASRMIPPYSAPYYWAPFILIDDFDH